MNFIEFLTEITWQHTGQTNPQGKPRYRPEPDRTLKTPRKPKQPKPSPMQAAQTEQPTEKPLNPEGDAALKPFMDASARARPDAVAMITLLGSIYQARRRNPAVQLTDMPKMANTELLKKLFKLAKDKDLPELAAMSQQIKNASTVDPNKAQAPAAKVGTPNAAGIAPTTAAPAQSNTQPQAAAGAPKPPEQQGSSPAQQTQLQQLLDIINKVAPNLTTRQIKSASKALNDKMRKATPIEQPNVQPGPKEVINTG